MTASNTNRTGMETDAHRWIASLRRTYDWLASLVRPLTSEQLRRPSYHTWSIAEVVGHLGSQAEIFDAGLTAALEGTDPPGREFMLPIWDTWNARSADDAVAESLRVNEQLVQRLEGLTDEQLTSMHVRMFGRELDAAGLVRLRLSELTLHTWDVAVALDPAATLPSDAVDLLIDTLGPPAARSGKPQGTAFRLQVHTSDPERRFLVQVGDAVELTGWDGGTADGELRMPAEALERLVYGRLDRDHTPTMQVTGPISLDDLRAIFPGF